MQAAGNMADLLPILSKEDEEEEDSTNTARFREPPPPYSENVDAQTSKQVSCNIWVCSSVVAAHGLNTTVKYDSKQETDHVEETEDIPELRVYTRRWYILALFCAMACHQVRIIYMNL